jgi:D123
MSEFKIPPLRMPTLEEHRATSAAWLKRIGSCLYENWPQTLKDLSFRTELVDLSEADRKAIWAAMDGKEAPEVARLVANLDHAIAAFGGEAFVKLSSRSPKDCWPLEGPEPFRSGADVLGTFAGSMRIADDLIEYDYADTPCYLLVREFQPIPKHEEWRCFIRKGEVVGISQYHYRDFFPQLMAERTVIAGRIHQFLADRVLPHLHLDTVVVDIWLRDEPLLIEINPYGLSDPCLLDYEEMETATGWFRIVETDPKSEAA